MLARSIRADRYADSSVRFGDAVCDGGELLLARTNHRPGGKQAGFGARQRDACRQIRVVGLAVRWLDAAPVMERRGDPGYRRSRPRGAEFGEPTPRDVDRASDGAQSFLRVVQRSERADLGNLPGAVGYRPR